MGQYGSWHPTTYHTVSFKLVVMLAGCGTCPQSVLGAQYNPSFKLCMHACPSAGAGAQSCAPSRPLKQGQGWLFAAKGVVQTINSLPPALPLLPLPCFTLYTLPRYLQPPSKICTGCSPLRRVCAGGSAVSMLLLLDRAVDPATPMCTQLTYEGSIDEVLHINNSIVHTETQGGLWI